MLQYNELAKSPMLDRRDPDDRARLLKAIERKGIEWTLTFDAIEYPIFLTSRDGAVVRMNRAARDLTGGTYASILGRNIASLGDGELWRSLDDLVKAVVDTRNSCSVRAVDAKEQHWDITCSVYEAEGEDRLILILRDITRIVTLQESVQRGEQLAALGELVAGVAHEVRNPLFGMLVTLDAYEPLVNNHGEDAEEMFSSMRLWIHRLNQLMEDLLQYGKAWHMELREGELGGVIDQAIAQSQPEASKANVRVTKKVEPGLRMLMDADRLTHAIQNAVMNAVQHSEPGDEVEVAASRDGAFVECVVRDHGPGFPPIDLGKVFQPFFTRRRGGTGLGLSILQRIIDEHGGTVAAENAEGGGALVRMRFPEFTTVDEGKP